MSEQNTETTETTQEIQTTQPQPRRTEVIVPDMLSMVTGSRADERDQLILMRAKFDYAQRIAKLFAVSGCFADVKDTREEVAIAKALVKIKLGESMGFTEAEAMSGIDIIQGRVAVGANLRAARMQRSGFSWPQMIVNDKGCWIPLMFKGEPLMHQKVDEDGQTVIVNGAPVMVQVVVSFTLKDAQLAGLSAKDNYKKDPSSMFFARAITRAQRRYGPGVLGIDILDTYEAGDLIETTEPVSRPDNRESPQEHSARIHQKIHEQAEEARKQAEQPTTKADDKPAAAETKAPAAETKPAATEPERAAGETKTGKGWPSRPEMMSAFRYLIQQLDEKEVWQIFGANSIAEEGELDPAGSNDTMRAFEALKAAVAAKNKPADEPETLFGNRNRTGRKS
jgi:hypothetical protein